MPKDYFHISMIGDATLIPEVIKLSVGRILKGTLEILPVKHGGETAEGKLQQVPSGREFMMTFLQRNSRFKVRDAVAAGKEFGLKTATIYNACNTLLTEGALKCVDVGEYALTSKAAVKKAATVRKGNPRKGLIVPPKEGSVPDRILKAVRKMQNGSGEGVEIAAIKKVLDNISGISPAITSLLKRKMIVRVASGRYRATSE